MASKMGMGEAVLWMLCCFPVGYVKLGQGLKWLVWLLICVVTGGLGTVAMLVDYFMCVQKLDKTGTLDEWEWFPRA